LEAALHRFQAFERIKQLQAGFLDQIRARRELLGVLDREFDSIDGDTYLIRHLEFYAGRPRIHSMVDSLKNLTHDFGTHGSDLDYLAGVAGNHFRDPPIGTSFACGCSVR
jgi:hypothetical protein